jgi:cytochrome c-type biogenesis protein CcmE
MVALDPQCDDVAVAARQDRPDMFEERAGVVDRGQLRGRSFFGS